MDGHPVLVEHDDITGEVDTGAAAPQPHYYEIHYSTDRLPYVYLEVGGVCVIEGYVVPGVPPRRQSGRKRWRS